MTVYVAEVAMDMYEPTHFVGVYSTEDLAVQGIQRWMEKELWYPYPDTARVIIECEIDKDA